MKDADVGGRGGGKMLAGGEGFRDNWPSCRTYLEKEKVWLLISCWAKSAREELKRKQDE